MRVYFINLEASVDRRNYLSAQLEKFGIDYEAFKAVEPPQADEWFRRYDEKRYLRTTGRPASPGEIAAFGSHAGLWTKAVETGEPLVVLEDDVEILPIFPSALDVADSLIEKYGFLRLVDAAGARRVRMTPVEKSGDFTVLWYTKYPFGSQGYAISPAAAAKFLDHCKVITGPPDRYIKRFWEHGQALYGLSPAPLGHNEFSQATVIPSRDRGKYGPGLRAQRMMTKLSSWLARARFNAKVRQSLGKLD
ncbi:MAG: glycosyltransferase family 25 protein [Gammaproteobacteria bacterium]